jgi:hypothetical protein
LRRGPDMLEKAKIKRVLYVSVVVVDKILEFYLFIQVYCPYATL